MRKTQAEQKLGTIEFNAKALDLLQNNGYKFVQVKGLTIDRHYEYVEPHILLLVPLKELPTDPLKKDIYEPIKSELLYKWAAEKNEYPQIVIVNNFNN
ncbi:MAG: hypothetical protein ABJA37_01730 [Ferruginibacter sp.]